MSDTFLQTTLYEEDLDDDKILDLSAQELITIPAINNEFLTVLYLQNNKLIELPDDFFPSCPSLKWLDLRENELSDIPKTVKYHPSLNHILLQNNKITSLPNELGTVTSLKVLQLSGNPLMYPPRDIIKAGTESILKFLNEKIIEEALEETRSIVSDKASASDCLELPLNSRSYNSVIDGPSIPPNKTLSVQFSERDYFDGEENELYPRIKSKCPKLAKSRSKPLPPHCQSAKYPRPLVMCPKKEQDKKIMQSILMDAALKKQKDLIAKSDKILQGRRNIELLKNWRKNYRNRQLTLSMEDDKYKLTPKSYPYDTNPEYMTLLSREDIEKDLPDKYRKRLFRRSKPTVARKSNTDAHLAMKIKKLFENLESMDLNRETMSPRTEQRVLLGEIQKISEIKQKLIELSTTNSRSVSAE
ncbi:leucine-rich repeat-containing protein 27-like [Bicyclus anynana]|uniref:Leucine-rich repeat-containing protein 27-like n=1 Tax=Bicyclus anynana TaxID=110368 RepID=A0A6J1P3D9_BICAN|nr:leucine-rich repeat-containing protein 27-like [Bicyclus anynana]